jgi:hypothetical protein
MSYSAASAERSVVSANKVIKFQELVSEVEKALEALQMRSTFFMAHDIQHVIAD